MKAYGRLSPAEEILGRETELARLRSFIASVAEGPAALLLEGEAGIGKTTLWEECVRLARQASYTVLVSRAAEAEAKLGFACLGDLFEDLQDSELRPLSEPQRRALEVALLRRDPEGIAVDPRAVSMAVLAVIRSLGTHAPVLVALDDLQWTDRPSERALRFVLRRFEGEPVGVLAARRSDRPDDATPLGLDLAMKERLQRMRIGPLSEGAISQIVKERLGERVPRPTARRLYNAAGGNAFFALEIARASQHADVAQVSVEGLPVPETLHNLVIDRLSRLGPTARRALLATAALSQPTVDLVSSALARKSGGQRALDEAATAQVIEIQAERITFTHPLLASAVYSSAAPGERRRLHRKLAELVADLEERGRHLALSADRPDGEIAHVVEAAAEVARTRGAPDSAAELYEHAARLTPPGDGSLCHQRTIDAAEAWLQAGDVVAARSSFAQAVETAPHSGARAHALMRFGAMLVLDLGPDLAAARDVYERARREAAGDPALIAAIEHDLAWLSHFRGSRADSSLHARRAVELAEQIGDEDRLAHALVLLAHAEARGGNEEASTFLEHAFRLQDRVKEAHFAARPQFAQALVLSGDGRFDEARAISLAEYQRALDRGDESSLPSVLEHLTIVERCAGNWEEAERYAREMYAAADRGGFMPAYHSAPYAWILALQGRVDEARTLAEHGARVADRAGIEGTFGGHRAVLGFIELSLGDARACATQLEPLSSRLTSEIDETGWFRFLADEIEARVALGELERSQELIERLAERRTVLLDRLWARGATERCRGLVLAATGDETAAGDAFRRALAEHEELGEPFELARTLLAQGRAARRFKRRRSARETLTRARELFEGLGAPLWVARTDEDLSRIGGRSPRGSGLTATEEQVARLAAEGLTNKQIGAELFISVNTVETNLKRVYRELGVRSRTELAGKFLAGAE